MKEVILYSTNWCPFCTAAKKLLERREIDYVEVNVEDDDEKRRWLAETTGQRTVPQIFIDGSPIGGYAELNNLDRSGELASMLR